MVLQSASLWVSVLLMGVTVLASLGSLYVALESCRRTYIGGSGKVFSANSIVSPLPWFGMVGLVVSCLRLREGYGLLDNLTLSRLSIRYAVLLVVAALAVNSSLDLSVRSYTPALTAQLCSLIWASCSNSAPTRLVCLELITLTVLSILCGLGTHSRSKDTPFVYFFTAAISTILLSTGLTQVVYSLGGLFSDSLNGGASLSPSLLCAFSLKLGLPPAGLWALHVYTALNTDQFKTYIAIGYLPTLILLLSLMASVNQSLNPAVASSLTLSTLVFSCLFLPKPRSVRELFVVSSWFNTLVLLLLSLTS